MCEVNQGQSFKMPVTDAMYTTIETHSLVQVLARLWDAVVDSRTRTAHVPTMRHSSVCAR